MFKKLTVGLLIVVLVMSMVNFAQYQSIAQDNTNGNNMLLGKDVSQNVIIENITVKTKADSNINTPEVEIASNSQVLPGKEVITRQHIIDIFFDWRIGALPSGQKIKEGDYFEIVVPKVTAGGVVEANFHDDSYPLTSSANGNKVVGEFRIDKENGILRGIFNKEAEQAAGFDSGKINFSYRAYLRSQLKIHPNQVNQNRKEPFSIEKDVLVTWVAITENNPDSFLIYGAETSEDGNKGLEWTLDINADQLKNMLEDRTVERRQNIWIEQSVEDPDAKINEDSLEFRPTLVAHTPDGKLSRDGISWPVYSVPATEIRKPAQGQSYEEFKAELQREWTDPDRDALKVAIYPKTATDGQKIILYLGNLGDDNSGYHYGDPKFKVSELEALGHIQNYINSNNANKETITPEQGKLMEKYYGLDSDPQTKPKKIIYYAFRFRTSHTKPAEYISTAEMNWNGGQAAPVKLRAFYRDASASSNPYTRLSVKKKWVGKVLGPVTVKLYKDGVYSGNQAVLDEKNDWSYVFRDLEMYRKDGSSDKIVYTVKEDLKEHLKGYEVKYERDIFGDYTITNTEIITLLPYVPDPVKPEENQEPAETPKPEDPKTELPPDRPKPQEPAKEDPIPPVKEEQPPIPAPLPEPTPEVPQTEGELDIPEGDIPQVIVPPKHGIIIFDGKRWKFIPDPNFYGKEQIEVLIKRPNGSTYQEVIIVNVPVPLSHGTLPQTSGYPNSMFLVCGTALLGFALVLKRQRG